MHHLITTAFVLLCALLIWRMAIVAEDTFSAPFLIRLLLLGLLFNALTAHLHRA